MTRELFIAGDWGTTTLRLALCDRAGIIERRTGPGVGRSAEPPEAVFLSLSADWRAAHGSLPAYLCGMVGARIGWREVPYASCPADPHSLSRGALTFEAAGCAISLAPGLTCTNPQGAPDVMRGEETQILGALLTHPDLAQGRHLLALPGTHTKWVELRDGAIHSFMTSPTGEIFALLRSQGTLKTADTATPRGFARGLARKGHLLQTLFETRTRQLIDGLSAEDAAGFLSGLLIGADVAGALDCYPGFQQVHLIGEPALSALYAEALTSHKVDSSAVDGGDCAFAGLRSIFT
ncbi:MAG TPA: 2-dehydro-3-deoxygalactonokinase [Magnetospirillaceae bacterium]|nr:2-dehydro-3-deoxygalactonokinase [Magnetospirillaceae bacterium]